MGLRRLRIMVVWVEGGWDGREDGFSDEMVCKVIFRKGL